jgi:hypothetical protein
MTVKVESIRAGSEHCWHDKYYSRPGSMSIGPWGLPPFTFRQVGGRWIEFQALPGPGARALRAKTMRHPSFSGSGGQAVLRARTRLFRCKGARSIRLDCERGASPCGSTVGSPLRILFPPMLFVRNALAPGPQGCFPAGKRVAKVKGGKDRGEGNYFHLNKD